MDMTAQRLIPDFRLKPDHRFMKWGLFAALFAVAPAPVIVFQTFMTEPVIFLAASIVTMTAEQWASGTTMTPMLIAYFALHLILFAGLYFLGAMAAARLICLIPNRPARTAAFAAAVMAALALALLPVYGGAGIHGGNWGTLAWFFGTLDSSHFGPRAVVIIYGGYFALLGAACLYRKLRGRRAARQAG